MYTAYKLSKSSVVSIDRFECCQGLLLRSLCVKFQTHVSIYVSVKNSTELVNCISFFSELEVPSPSATLLYCKQIAVGYMVNRKSIWTCTKLYINIMPIINVHKLICPDHL